LFFKSLRALRLGGIAPAPYKPSTVGTCHPTDWVFASTRLKGKQPRVANILVEDYLRPAAVNVGVLKEGEKVRFGFHNLRHSLASFLVRKGTDVKTVQKMLRHSDVATTLGIYAHSMSEDRLAAQDDMLAAMMTPVKRSELSDHTRKTQMSDTARLLPYSPSLVQNFGLSLQVR
jgi:integrase